MSCDDQTCRREINARGIYVADATEFETRLLPLVTAQSLDGGCLASYKWVVESKSTGRLVFFRVDFPKSIQRFLFT